MYVILKDKFSLTLKGRINSVFDSFILGILVTSNNLYLRRAL